jgi:hypothetical protein
MYEGFIRDCHTHLKPTLLTMTMILEAWARAGQVERAWAAFGRVLELHDLGILPTGPDLPVYNIMMSCLFRCHTPDCVVYADTLLQEMKQNPNTQPEIFSYAYMIQLWLLTPDGLDRAVLLALEALPRQPSRLT